MNRRKLLERDVQKKSVAAARKAGWWARKFTAQGRRSAPDYIFARNGTVFFVEFKATGCKPTGLQLAEHREIYDAGLSVYIVDDPDIFDSILTLNR